MYKEHAISYTVIQPNNGAKTGEVMKRFFLVRCSLIFK